MSFPSLPILIAGAGIGGLTAALALLRRGYAVEIFEQASVLGEVGAGLQLSANATRALGHLGIGNALRQVSSEPAGKEVRLWSTGQTWKLFDLGEHSIAQYGYPYYTIYRPDLHQVLAEAVHSLAPNAIRLGTRCTGFEQNTDSVILHLEDGEEVKGSALIGAEGVHSRVRNQLFGVDEAQYSGCMAWRGVIPIERLPASLLRPVGTNWVGPGRHVIHYPLRGGKLMNFVGIVETDQWVAESWTQKGSHDECHADFAGWHDDVHELIKNIETPYKWALMARSPLSRWTEGRVSLLGDACHPTLPFLAQGAAMAIEDGYILARAIDAFPDDVPQALARYELARIERTSQIVLKSTENGRRFHNPALADAQGAETYVDREWSEEKVKERYDWLFRYDVDQVNI